MIGDWKVKKLTQVFDFKGGSQPPKSVFKFEPEQGYVRMLQIRDFSRDDKAVYIPEESSSRRCESNDILIGRYGASVGKICTGKAGAYNVALMKVTPIIQELDSKYSYYYFNSNLFQKSLLAISSRGAQNGFNVDNLSTFDFLLPPLPEQKRIVAILDQAFEAIDQAQANIERNIKNAEELFQSKLNEVFSETGDGWEVKPISELTTIVTKGSSPKWQGVSYVETPGVLFVTSENVGEGRILLKKRKYVEGKFNQIERKSILKRGDVLTNIVGASIGRTAIYNSDELANINQAVCLMRCDENSLLNKYLMMLLNSPFFKKVMHENEVDNARANLSLTFFKNLKIPIPPFTKQQELVEELERFQETIEEVALAFRTKLGNSEELKKSLLQKAFSGELTEKEVVV